MPTSNNSLKFSAEDQQLKDILFSNSKYRIPRYQRPYAWKEEQVADFWSDLIETNNPHFIGSIILNLENIETDKVIDIIDGQKLVATVPKFGIVENAARAVALPVGPTLPGR